MDIIYKEIDLKILEKINEKYGEWAKKHIHINENSYSLAVFYNDIPIAFISTYIRQLIKPLEIEKDAYIDVIEVDENFRRKGIASELIKNTENWVKSKDIFQIRSWSSQDKIEAIPMWYSLEYCMCPSKIWVEWCKEIVNGYYVVKKIR